MRTPTSCSLVRPVLVLLGLALISSCALIEPYTATDDNQTESPEADDDGPRAPAAEAGPATDRERPRDDTAPQPDEQIAPSDAAEDPPEGEPWRRLAAGQQSAVRVPLARAITSPEAWIDVWAALTANQLPAPERPKVDFDEETVVVLLLGERRTGGYSVEIGDLRIERSDVEVVVRVSRPAPADMVTQALTSPWYVAAIPVSGRDVRFTGEDVTRGFEGD